MKEHMHMYDNKREELSTYYGADNAQHIMQLKLKREGGMLNILPWWFNILVPYTLQICHLSSRP
jgi:hypothetical protein